jgi:hypothetical protein
MNLKSQARVRRLALATFCALLLASAIQHALPFTGNSGDSPAITTYDSDPAHMWNRLHESLFIREDQSGAKYGRDSLDPLLWIETEHLLVGPSHQGAISILDEFISSHAENLIRDPRKRAVLQRDLWAVFDWSVREQGKHERERRALQIRLAEVLRRLALTPEEIQSLPNNYAQAVVSGEFPKEYDPTKKEQAFLPPELFQARGPWVCISGDGREPVADNHVYEISGRSRFLVFMRLPGGRKATLDYLQTLWNSPQPWSVHPGDPNQVVPSPNLPQFPVGTQVALVRQMTLFDRDGTLVPAPITESVQIRVYRSIPARRDQNRTDVDQPAARTEQAFYEIRLGRGQLFTGKAGGLRAVASDEKEFPVFRTHGDDVFESSAREHFSLKKLQSVILNSCAVCHSAPGINSINSRSKLLKPTPLQHDPEPGGEAYGPPWWENDATISWKQRQYDWGLLNGYWRGSATR